MLSAPSAIFRHVYAYTLNESPHNVRPSQLEISNARSYTDPPSFDLPALESTFEAALLSYPCDWDDGAALGEFPDSATIREDLIGDALGEVAVPTAVASPNNRSTASSTLVSENISSLPEPNENSLNSTSAPPSRGSDKLVVMVCPDCPDKPPFRRKHLYNRHRKSHDRPHKCKIGECKESAAWKRDLDRHIAPKHPEVANHVTFFCTYSHCDRAQNGTRGGFSRKDTLKRHLKTHCRRAKDGQ